MSIRKPTQQHVTPEQIGLNIEDRAFGYAQSIRQIWKTGYGDFFGQPRFTVADLQRATDAMDERAIADGGTRSAVGLLTAHQLLQAVLRRSLPAEIMQDDPTESPVPYTIESTKHGPRIVWDASARYPTEPIDDTGESERTPRNDSAGV